MPTIREIEAAPGFARDRSVFVLSVSRYSVDDPLVELSLDDFLSIGSAGVPFIFESVEASALTQPLLQPSFHSSWEIVASFEVSTISKFRIKGVALSFDSTSPSGPAVCQAL